MNINEWNKNIVLKSNQYYQTENVKNIKCKTCKDWNHHGFKQNKNVISLSHLQCIILYCDFTKLCTDFSAGFRKKT